MQTPSNDPRALVRGSDEQGLFAVLGASLAEFRAAVEGEDGAKVELMGADDGLLPDIIRGTIKGLAEVLTWLHRVADEIDDYVLQGDAVVALFEIGAEAISALAGGLDIGPLAEAAGVAPGAIEAINGALDDVQAGVAVAQKLVGSILPPAEEIQRISAELDALLGRRDAPPLERSGSLTQLMQRIGL
ncbi:hypothetical protein [Haliangium sp.]|uniref:hypothetical protein n=1 Tax=Haliangium sp. TaxID=2663208 RepID=UPI003D0FEDCB